MLKIISHFHLCCFVFPVQRRPLFFSSAPSSFLFQFSAPFSFLNVLPFFSPKHWSFQSKNVGLFSPKTLVFLCVSPLLVSAYQNQRDPLFLRTSKVKKKSSFSSVHPRPNILSSCFTSPLFE